MTRSPWKTDVLLTGSWRGATSVLLRNGRYNIVVDTGMPHEAHLLVEALAARNLRPEDIHFVINTHFHIDHVLNNSIFEKSEIYASQESHNWCLNLYSAILDEANWQQLALVYYPETLLHDRAREFMSKLRKLALRWWDAERLGKPAQLRWVEKARLPEGLEGIMTSGHVPGHVSVLVPDPEERILIAGDALLSRDQDHKILTMIPFQREQYSRDRERILSLGGRILPGHDQGFCATEARPSGVTKEL
jgi:glyoxylase-like metal-dependent hydrolase (beta-lactamase superfamily II)